MLPPPSLPPESIYTRCYCEENIYLLCRTFLQDPTVKDLWEIFVVFISNANKTVGIHTFAAVVWPLVYEAATVNIKNFAQVALWYQKAARFPDSPVIWDYHVILILRPRRKALTTNAEQSAMHSSWVYDFDTILDLPCPWEEYLSMSFPEALLPAYQRSAFHDWPKILFTLSKFSISRFRVIHGELYLQNFASDRSHMLRKTEGSVNDDSDTAREIEELVYFSPPPTYAIICGPSAAERGITNNLMEQYVYMSHASEVELYGVVLDRLGVNSFFDD